MKKRILVLMLLALLTLAPAPARADALTQDVAPPIIFEATVEPAQWSALRFEVAGEVAALPVEVGAEVTAGEPLVQLDQAAANLALEEAEAAVEIAETQLALVKAGPRAEEIAAAEAQIEAAEGSLAGAVAVRDQLQSGVQAAALAGARAELEAARAALKQADLTINELEGSDEPADQKRLQLLRLKVQAAEARVAVLPAIQVAHLRAVNAGVRAAEAQVDAAAAELALVKAGPTAAEIAQAEAEVRQAEADRRAAEVALARTTLRAPFDGAVTQVHVEVGANVSTEHPVLVLAALDHLRLKTLDATELDVVHLAVGQEVRVTVDALPDQSFTGRITRIKQQSADYRGDVTYPVLIELESPPPELRWGMTALVEVIN